MPYSIDRKNKCVYKKKQDGSRGEKVGCTKKNLDSYVAALQIHAEGKKPQKKLSIREQMEQNITGAITQLFAVKKPYSGCELTSLVKPIDPLMGIGAGHEIMPDQIHAVYADEDIANDTANSLYEDFLKKEKLIEDKKSVVSDKIKKAIDTLEKQRKDQLDMVKEDPKNASKYRDKIASLVSKIDDFVSKLEKIEKSKKEIEDKEEKKTKNKK